MSTTSNIGTIICHFSFYQNCDKIFKMKYRNNIYNLCLVTTFLSNLQGISHVFVFRFNTRTSEYLILICESEQILFSKHCMFLQLLVEQINGVMLQHEISLTFLFYSELIQEGPQNYMNIYNTNVDYLNVSNLNSFYPSRNPIDL